VQKKQKTEEEWRESGEEAESKEKSHEERGSNRC